MATQNLLTFEKALKENYLPVFNNLINTDPSAFLAKVKKPTLKSNRIVASAPIGLSGGFGFSSEGFPTPDAAGVQYSRFILDSKDMYVNVEISQKAISLTKDSGAMANALDTEMKAAYETAKWNVGRALFGNGSGILANISKTTTSQKVFEVDSVKYLKEGLLIDLYATSSEEPYETDLRIISIDRVNKKVTIDKEISAKAGFVTVQKSYKKEITGLNTIYDDTVTTIYGMSKTDNPILKPTVIDASGDIGDGIITKTLREAELAKNGRVNLIMMGNDAYDAYVDYLRTSNIRVEDRSHTITGGFNAIKFIFGNREVDIVNEQFVPDKEAWGVNTEDFEFHSFNWTFSAHNTGGIFTLVPGTSYYRALLYNYGELLCKNPGGCLRITSCC